MYLGSNKPDASGCGPPGLVPLSLGSTQPGHGPAGSCHQSHPGCHAPLTPFLGARTHRGKEGEAPDAPTIPWRKLQKKENSERKVLGAMLRGQRRRPSFTPPHPLQGPPLRPLLCQLTWVPAVHKLLNTSCWHSRGRRGCVLPGIGTGGGWGGVEDRKKSSDPAKLGRPPPLALPAPVSSAQGCSKTPRTEEPGESGAASPAHF